MLVPVILCGGSGTRLWPMSRQNCPKQFLNLTDEKFSLFQKTILRLPSWCHKPIIICNESHRFIVAEQLREINTEPHSIILEPEGRNTAPAIAICALESLDIDKNSSIIVLSADHEINDINTFHQTIDKSTQLIEKNYLVAFGIKPSRPETGYGYIQSHHDSDGINRIDSFEEKPNYDKAIEYLKSENYFWNSGMFAMKSSVYLDEMKLHEPYLLKDCIDVFENITKDFDFKRLDKLLFSKCKNISIDYAVMEKTSNAVMVEYSSSWSDVGSWESLWLEKNKDDFGNVLEGDIFIQNVNNSYIQSHNKFTSVIGLDDIVIVDTKDALLISNKKFAHLTKDVVHDLKKNNREEYINHKKVHRPWGCFESLEKQDGYQVKLLTLKSGAKISLQKHNHRAEHWIVIHGEAIITCNEKKFKLSKNQSTFIPQGSIHRLENQSKEILKVIEVQTGDYLGEDDILRVEDIYNRGN